MNTNILPRITVASPTVEQDGRSHRQQYEEGFAQYADDVRSGDYLSAEEFACMTSHEQRGYRDAINAADYADFCQWREVRNSFGDATMGNW